MPFTPLYEPDWVPMLLANSRVQCFDDDHRDVLWTWTPANDVYWVHPTFASIIHSPENHPDVYYVRYAKFGIDPLEVLFALSPDHPDSEEQ